MATIIGTAGRNILIGTAKLDRIYGRAGDDGLIGLEGDDNLLGGPGNDQLDGGGGIDTATFTGQSAAYRFERRPTGGWIIEHDGGLGQEGTEILQNIEFLRFSDKIVRIE